MKRDGAGRRIKRKDGPAAIGAATKGGAVIKAISGWGQGCEGKMAIAAIEAALKRDPWGRKRGKLCEGSEGKAAESSPGKLFVET